MYSFAGTPDGQLLFAGLIFDNAGNFYGTTNGGGPHLFGTVYKLTPSAGGQWTETILYGFQGPRMGVLRSMEWFSIVTAISMEQLRSAASSPTVRRAWCSTSHRRLVALPPFRKGGEKDGAPGSVGGEVKAIWQPNPSSSR